MTKTPTVKVAVMMNATRAKLIIKTVNHNMTEAGALLLELRDQEGWKALGYTSFRECCEKELADQFGSRSQVYRLMEQAAVIENIGASVPITLAAALNQLPAEEQRAALKEAGGKGATLETVTKVVEQRGGRADIAAARTTPTKSKPAAKDNPKLEKALERIGKICGAPVKKALEHETLKLAPKEVIFWAGLKDPDMADIQELVVSKRWAPTKAHKFRSRQVDSKTTVEDLISHAMAEGGTWEGTVNGFDIVVKERRRR